MTADADQLRERISGDLCDHERDLVVERERPSRHEGEGRGGEGLAERVHREVRRESGESGDGRKERGIRPFEQAAQAGRSPGVLLARLGLLRRGPYVDSGS